MVETSRPEKIMFRSLQQFLVHINFSSTSSHDAYRLFITKNPSLEKVLSTPSWSWRFQKDYPVMYLGVLDMYSSSEIPVGHVASVSSTSASKITPPLYNTSVLESAAPDEAIAPKETVTPANKVTPVENVRTSRQSRRRSYYLWQA